jgi:hypothetical protein
MYLSIEKLKKWLPIDSPMKNRPIIISSYECTGFEININMQAIEETILLTNIPPFL